jgi:hypothetical protein
VSTTPVANEKDLQSGDFFRYFKISLRCEHSDIVFSIGRGKFTAGVKNTGGYCKFFKDTGGQLD